MRSARPRTRGVKRGFRSAGGAGREDDERAVRGRPEVRRGVDAGGDASEVEGYRGRVRVASGMDRGMRAMGMAPATASTAGRSASAARMTSTRASERQCASSGVGARGRGGTAVAPMRHTANIAATYSGPGCAITATVARRGVPSRRRGQTRRTSRPGKRARRPRTRSTPPGGRRSRTQRPRPRSKCTRAPPSLAGGAVRHRATDQVHGVPLDARLVLTSGAERSRSV